MKEKEILKDVADTLTEKPVKVTVDILRPSLFEKITKRTKKTFYFKPFCLATMVKVSELFLNFDSSKIDRQNLITGNFGVIKDNAKTFAEAIAVAVVNGKNEPSGKLVDFFYYNLNASELAAIVLIILKQLKVDHFMISIISISGVNILEESNRSANAKNADGMNPQDQTS